MSNNTSGIKHDPRQPDDRFHTVSENIDSEVHREIKNAKRGLRRQREGKQPDGPTPIEEKCGPWYVDTEDQ